MFYVFCALLQTCVMTYVHTLHAVWLVEYAATSRVEFSGGHGHLASVGRDTAVWLVLIEDAVLLVLVNTIVWLVLVAGAYIPPVWTAGTAGCWLPDPVMEITIRSPTKETTGM